MESKIMKAFEDAKEAANKLGIGTYSLDDILHGNEVWDSLPWQNKGAVGERFSSAVKHGEIKDLSLGTHNDQTGDRLYIKV